MAVEDSDIMELLGELPVSNNKAVPVMSPPSSPGTSRELSIAGDAYNGASQVSREMLQWSPAIRSADQDIIPVKGTVDGRVRDSLRNDAYIAGAANLHRDNIVGSQFMLNSKPVTTVLFGKEDDVWEDEFQEEVEEKFTLWAESPQNWIDASRKNTLTGLVRLAVGIHVARGEVLASAEWMRDGGSMRPYSTAIQLIDLDRLSTPPEFSGDTDVRGGVRVNKYGAPQGYYVRVNHPSEWSRPDSFKWKYMPRSLPWNRMQMLHIFDQHREAQTRGMSQMVSALEEIHMTKNFRKMVLQNAVLNATYAASIESDLPTEEIFARLGGADLSSETVSNAIQQYMGGHFKTIAEFMGGSKNLNVNGAKIPHLPPGTRLKLHGAGQGGPLGTDFEESLLRHIAASLDVSYEQLSRDYSKTNYSSARAAMTESWKALQSRKKSVADTFATHIYRLWLEEAINGGEIKSLPRRAPSWYEGQNADAYSACEWIGASRGQIDELKETQAAALRIDRGLSSLEVEAARLGIDWRKLLRQLAREQEWKKFYGVLQDIDKSKDMMNAVTGEPRAVSEDTEESEGS